MENISEFSKFFLKTHKLQFFSFPDLIILYICENLKPSNNVLPKLYFSCKYFWCKIKIIPIESKYWKNYFSSTKFSSTIPSSSPFSHVRKKSSAIYKEIIYSRFSTNYYAILDEKNDEWQSTRYLFAKSDELMHLSETKLINIIGDLCIDKGSICASYTKAMLLGGFLTGSLKNKNKKESILILGLGGGAMNNFLSTLKNQPKVTIVEIDPIICYIAQKWFDSKPSEFQTFIIDDAIDFLLNRKIKNSNYLFDTILIDCSSTDYINNEYESPIPQFLNQNEIIELKRNLKPDGTVALNVVLNVKKGGRLAKLQYLYSKFFKSCFYLTIEYNYVLICTDKKIKCNNYFNFYNLVQRVPKHIQVKFDPLISQSTNMKNTAKRLHFYANPVANQNFSFPDSIILYICVNLNQTNKVLLMLYFSCKFFWSKIKILPILNQNINVNRASEPINSAPCFKPFWSYKDSEIVQEIIYSPFSEDCYAIVDYKMLEGGMIRTLYSEKQEGWILTHSKLKQNNKEKIMSIDKENIHASYARGMLLGGFLTGSLKNKRKNESILILGLGGGAMNNFLSTLKNQSKVTIVEIDPIICYIARKWFDSKPSESQTFIIDDAINFLLNRKIKCFEDLFDAILVDCSSADSLDCPLLPQFLNPNIIQEIKRNLKPQGTVVINTASLNRLSRKKILEKPYSIYPTFFKTCFDLKADSNCIFICTDNDIKVDSYVAWHTMIEKLPHHIYYKLRHGIEFNPYREEKEKEDEVKKV